MERLLTVLAEALEAPRHRFTPESKAGEVEGWDSIGTLRIVTAVQMEYSVSLTLDEMAEMDSVPQIEAVLRRKGCALE